jgi:hypothetical protein
MEPFDYDAFYHHWFDSQYSGPESDYYLLSRASDFGERFKTALGLDWELVNSEFVKKVVDEEGDHVANISHVWEVLPRWGAARNYDRSTMTPKGVDKTFRSVWNKTSIQAQFDQPSMLFAA